MIYTSPISASFREKGQGSWLAWLGAESFKWRRFYKLIALTGLRQAVVHLGALLYHETSSQIMMEIAMIATVREKFSSQAAPEVLAALRQIAEAQGRQFQAVLDEALRDYIDRQQKERPRRHVLTSFGSSLNEFDSLYRELAK